MKLIHITTVPESLGFLKGQAKFMRDRGIDVCAVSSPGERLKAFAHDEGVPVKAIAMTRRISPWRDLVALLRLVHWLRTQRPEIVHAHTPKAGLLGMLAARIAGVPVRIYHLRGLPLMTARGWRRWLLAWTETIACRQAHRVLAVSRSLREVAIDRRLCPADKIHVLHNGSGQGVDAEMRFNPNRVSPQQAEEVRDRFGIPRDALVIGFVGRLVRDKGVGELAEAWAMLRDRYSNVHLLIVGPEERRDALPSQVISQLQADDRIHLAGADWNTPPFYAAMDVVALPTYREGFGNVLLEAAAMRLPVVTTNATGARDAVVDDVTGTLIPVKDAAALAAALAAYVGESFLRQRHGLAGRQRALQDFSPENIWQGIFATYDELLSMKGLPRPVGQANHSLSRRAA